MFAMALGPGRILAGVLREANMQPKEAAILSETDPGQFCKMLAGTVPFDLKRLERLPYRIVASFWRLWFFAYLDQDMTEMQNTKLVMARADLRSREDERKVG